MRQCRQLVLAKLQKIHDGSQAVMIISFFVSSIAHSPTRRFGRNWQILYPMGL